MADLKYNTLANGHGPILRYNVEQLVTNYRDWSMAVEKGSTQVGCVRAPLCRATCCDVLTAGRCMKVTMI